ncbi:MAG: hypothetical protein PF961_12900 [Planctomycetota bacterium]|jgi:hypothetical protein|nr:hypothetical protein [Planctomycetota bacterium]
MSTRHGGGFIRFIIGIAVLAVLLIVGWGIFANWKRSGEVNAHVLDKGWWDVSKEEAQPLVQEARDWAIAKKEEIWGDGGLVDQSEDWLEDWRERESERNQEGPVASQHSKAENPNMQPDSATPTQRSTDTATTAGAAAADATAKDSAAAADTGPSPATTRLEERIHAAEQHFAEGLEDFRAANPEDGWTDERVAHYDSARSHFIQVRRILVEENVSEDYALMDDANPRTVKQTRELVLLNQKLLYDANKSGSF